MKISMITLLNLAFLLLAGCGAQEFQSEESKSKEEEEQKEEEEKLEQERLTVKESEPQDIELTGYISSAFEVMVDGKRYDDSEDFYGEQLDRLQTEANNGGYEGWILTFDAEIGLNDLKNGMRIYVAPESGKGYASEDDVSVYDGSFQFTIPGNSVQNRYKLRANKRINVALVPPEGSEDQAVNWCYNFSAEEQGVSIDGQPVILRTFKSRITKYRCTVSDAVTGISIPARKSEEVSAELDVK